jgi:uncharacterized protein
MKPELNSFWSRFFDFNWKFGFFLIALVCIPRFIMVLYANESRNYGLIGLVMILSALTPFIFLSTYGRRVIGMTKTRSFTWGFIAFFSGLMASIVLYIIGNGLYGDSFQNWYRYIGQSMDRNLGFAALAIPSMVFSPIGEELFFRGIVHSSFAKSIGEHRASVVDGSAFAFTHVSHFGLVFINGRWDFFIIPTLIWITAMFGVSYLFFVFRKKTDSIGGAILCHAAFNLAMIFCIYYLL